MTAEQAAERLQQVVRDVRERRAELAQLLARYPFDPNAYDRHGADAPLLDEYGVI